jgi:tetratricopeptide (TPR) repeat protein
MIRLADIQSLQNQEMKARESAESAIAIAKRARSLKLEADAKFFLAGLETMAGSMAEGLTKLDQSLALYKAAGRADGQLGALGQMACIYKALKMKSQSDAINEEMLALAELENNPGSVAAALVNAAISAAEGGDKPGAAEYLYKALRICRKNGYWDLITVALIDFADAVSVCEGPEDLGRYYLAAVASARRRFDETREIEAMHKLATAYLASGTHDRASATANVVIRFAQHQGIFNLLGDAKRIAGVCAGHQGNEEGANKYFSEALSLSHLCNDERLEASVLADKGDWLAESSPNKAEGLWREARNIFCRLGENAQVLRLDRSLIRHTFEHASQPLRYSKAV